MKKHIHYAKGFKYVIITPPGEEDYTEQISIYPPQDINTRFVSLSKNGILTIRDGFANDGPSGPTIDWDSGKRGGFVHDALAYLMRCGLLDKSWYHKSNDGLKEDLLEDGMFGWHADLWYRGVETDIARASAMKKRKIYTAP